MSKGLGRKRVADSRDGNYLIRSILPKRISITSKYWYDNTPFLNQGSTSQCVAYSLTHWLYASPIIQGGLRPQELYQQAQKVDEWEGENYDGTSVRAGAKVLQDNGYIKEFRWAWDLQTLIDAVLTKGPVVVGTTWYEDMFYPKDGVVKVGGSAAGGHAWLITGVNTKTRLFRAKNSWGQSWGKNGRFWISFDDMDTLVKDYGEVLLAIENKKSP
jgi:hypothetical protein